MRTALKMTVGAAWLFALSGFFMAAGSTAGSVARSLFWILLVVHAIECVAFLPTLRRSSRPLPLELAGVLLFGAIHYGEVRESLGDAAG